MTKGTAGSVQTESLPVRIASSNITVSARRFGPDIELSRVGLFCFLNTVRPAVMAESLHNRNVLFAERKVMSLIGCPRHDLTTKTGSQSETQRSVMP